MFPHMRRAAGPKTMAAAAFSPLFPVESSFAVAASGTDNVVWTSFSDATLTGNSAGDPISGSQYWRLLKITAASSGNKRLIFRNELRASAGTAPADQFFNADIQIAYIRIGTTEYPFTNLRPQGFETNSAFSTGPSSQSLPTSWSPIGATSAKDGTPGGWFVRDGVTGSNVTGRLVVPEPIATGATALSYMYSETSSPVAFGDYIWARSPVVAMTQGDVVYILMGIDAPAAGRFYAYLAAA